MDEAIIAKIARALCQSRGINPDSLYQHNSEGDYPLDQATDYIDSFTGQKRTMLFHRAWRHDEKHARALLPLVGEEMAKIAEGQTFTEDNDMYWNGWNDALEHVVEAIRQSTGATS